MGCVCISGIRNDPSVFCAVNHPKFAVGFKARDEVCTHEHISVVQVPRTVLPATDILKSAVMLMIPLQKKTPCEEEPVLAMFRYISFDLKKQRRNVIKGFSLYVFFFLYYVYLFLGYH